MGKGLFEGWHIVVLLLVIVVLFGWKRLPDAARGLGRSMRIFKSEVEEMKKDGKAPPSAASSDTVRGETVRPAPEPAPEPTREPTREPNMDPPVNQASAPTEREMHNRPPV